MSVHEECGAFCVISPWPAGMGRLAHCLYVSLHRGRAQRCDGKTTVRTAGPRVRTVADFGDEWITQRTEEAWQRDLRSQCEVQAAPGALEAQVLILNTRDGSFMKGA